MEEEASYPPPHKNSGRTLQNRRGKGKEEEPGRASAGAVLFCLLVCAEDPIGGNKAGKEEWGIVGVCHP